MSYDATTAAAVNAMGNVTANVVANSGNKRSQKRAEEMNKKFWRMQNEYNHPSAQMARLQEAGLNPNLIYGDSVSGASGQAESIAPAKPAKFEAQNPLQNINSIADVTFKGAQTDNLRSQNTVLQQEAALKAAQTANTAQQEASSQFELNLAKELRQTSAEAAKESLRYLKQGTIQRELDNTIKDQTVKNQIENIYYRAETAKEALTGEKQLNELRRLEIELKRLGIERGDPWYYRVLGRTYSNFKNEASEFIKESKKRSDKYNPFNK